MKIVIEDGVYGLELACEGEFKEDVVRHWFGWQISVHRIIRQSTNKLVSCEEHPVLTAIMCARCTRATHGAGRMLSVKFQTTKLSTKM